jgi:hypothetical protein
MEKAFPETPLGFREVHWTACRSPYIDERPEPSNIGMD